MGGILQVDRLDTNEAIQMYERKSTNALQKDRLLVSTVGTDGRIGSEDNGRRRRHIYASNDGLEAGLHETNTPASATKKTMMQPLKPSLHNGAEAGQSTDLLDRIADSNENRSSSELCQAGILSVIFPRDGLLLTSGPRSRSNG